MKWLKTVSFNELAGAGFLKSESDSPGGGQTGHVEDFASAGAGFATGFSGTLGAGFGAGFGASFGSGVFGVLRGFNASSGTQPLPCLKQKLYFLKPAPSPE